MQVEIKITTSDIEFGFYLTGARRFPSRWHKKVPGNATIVSQWLVEGDESVNFADVMDITVEFDEGSSLEEFAGWLYDKLEKRRPEIISLVIAGKETQIDKDEMLRAVEAELKTAGSQ